MFERIWFVEHRDDFVLVELFDAVDIVAMGSWEFDYKFSYLPYADQSSDITYQVLTLHLFLLHVVSSNLRLHLS